MKLFGILLLLVCAATQPLTLAQSLAQSVRVVQGTVLNSDGQPLANAVVYLQDQKQEAIQLRSKGRHPEVGERAWEQFILMSLIRVPGASS